MKVLMLGRVDLMNNGGGDKVQIENTASELRKLGVDVDIKCGFSINYSAYDLVHIFQLDWTPEPYIYAKACLRHKKPLVLSPIHHNIDEVIRFETEYSFDFRKLSMFLFSDQFKRDTLKNIYRSIFDVRKLYPTVVSVFLGLKYMHTMVLKWSNAVLVQTQREATDLNTTYNVSIKWEKIPNGVGEQFLNVVAIEKATCLFDFTNYILCVGRIEARKNQINIIHAVKLLRDKYDIDLKLVFVGRKSKAKHFSYIHEFESLVSKYPWIVYHEEVPYNDMPAIYKFAKVCISASWFETTGLTSLEAIFCGTNAVASGIRAYEYLGDDVSYCDPGSIDSIAEALYFQYLKPRPEISSMQRIEYTWENAAKKTLEVYKKLLSKATL